MHETICKFRPLLQLYLCNSTDEKENKKNVELDMEYANNMVVVTIGPIPIATVVNGTLTSIYFISRFNSLVISDLVIVQSKTTQLQKTKNKLELQQIFWLQPCRKSERATA